MIIRQMTVGRMAVFCYVIGCENTRDALVIDPAGDEDKVVEAAKRENLNIKFIFNSHGHPDHTCGNARMKELTGAGIVMHHADDDFFNSDEGVRMARMWGFTPSPRADVRLNGDEDFKLGDLVLKVLHTPGHTPGGVCLLADKHLFTGDTMFVGSGGRTDLPGADLNQLLESIKKIVSLPDDTIIMPGHHYGRTPTSTVAQEKKTNVYVVEFDLLQ